MCAIYERRISFHSTPLVTVVLGSGKYTPLGRLRLIAEPSRYASWSLQEDTNAAEEYSSTEFESLRGCSIVGSSDRTSSGAVSGKLGGAASEPGLPSSGLALPVLLPESPVPVSCDCAVDGGSRPASQIVDSQCIVSHCNGPIMTWSFFSFPQTSSGARGFTAPSSHQPPYREIECAVYM